MHGTTDSGCFRLVGVGEASFVSLAAPFIDDNAPVSQVPFHLFRFYFPEQVNSSSLHPSWKIVPEAHCSKKSSFRGEIRFDSKIFLAWFISLVKRLPSLFYGDMTQITLRLIGIFFSYQLKLYHTDIFSLTQKTAWLAAFYMCIPTGYALGYVYGGLVSSS